MRELKVKEFSIDADGNESITVISNYRFIYRGYLQIACCDLTRTAHPCLWLITWDPAQPVATRPLAIQKDGTWFCYGWDLTKNICEVFGQNGYIRTAYSYTPYGSVTANGDITQPIQWSSEYADTELALTYYNYRHYNPMDGRWLGRDLNESFSESSLYCYCKNSFLNKTDYLGLWLSYTHRSLTENSIGKIRFTHKGQEYKLSYTAYKLIENGNVDTDSGDKRKQQKYHFCSHFEEKQKAKDAIDAYTNTLKEEIKNFYDSISLRNPTDAKCRDALKILGLITHMWQDYYAHGMEKENTEDPGLISGSPDKPKAYPASFYMNSWFHMPGTHGGFNNLIDP